MRFLLVAHSSASPTPPAEPPEGALLLPGDRMGMTRPGTDEPGPGIPLIVGVGSRPDEGVLADALALRPAAVLAEAEDGQALGQLDARLAVAEAEAGLPHGSTGAWALAGTTPAAVMGLASLAGATARLRGLVWHAAPLATALQVRPDAGPLGLARGLVVIAAAAAGVPAFAVEANGRAARRDGFAGLVLGWPD